MFDIEKDILDSFINPKEEARPSLWKRLRKKEDLKADLLKKQERYLLLTDYLKSHHWRDIQRPRVIDALRNGFGKLLRDGLGMTEVETKIVISDMRSNLEIIADMRYEIEAGLKAIEQLERMGKK